MIYYDVEIGENTLVGDGASIREKCRVGSKCIISRYVTLNYNTTVGDRTKIMDLTHITGNCVIGDDVFVSVLVGTANDNAIGHLGYDETQVIGPALHDGAAVGVGASLLPGITVGEGAIVGTGAVVAKDVAPHTLVIGVPAKFVRSLKRAAKRITAGIAVRLNKARNFGVPQGHRPKGKPHLYRVAAARAVRD